MGQCMSRKAAGAFAASAAAAHTRPSKKSQLVNNNDMYTTLKSPDDDNNKHQTEDPLKSPTTMTSNRTAVINNGNNKKAPPYTTKGVAMSFGFRRRPTTAPSIASNASAARRLANAVDTTAKPFTTDRNGNEDDTQALTINSVPVGRSTPRLAPPKKEPNATQRVSRFGYRDKVNRLSRVADLNGQFEYNNSNSTVPAATNFSNTEKRTNYTANVKLVDNNRNPKVRPAGIPQPTQGIGRYTLQTTQLPRPESVRLIETKTAKTLANNNRKVQSSMYHNRHEDGSSKDGSLTEDSGVGSNHSGNDMPGVEKLDASPTFRRRPLHNYYYQKPRTLEVVKTGVNTFDVRDVEQDAPLPQLPTTFSASSSRKSSYQPTGMVRERTFEYQRYLDRDNRRKISVTSSEGYSDDYGDEEKTFHDRTRTEKTFLKPKTFLKSSSTQKIEMDRLSLRADDSSPPSSDEHDWMQAGEAMADETSISLSSSDESRDKMQLPLGIRATPSSKQANSAISAALQNLMATSLTRSINKSDTKNVLLSIEDPKFAAVASSAEASTNLDNETLLSPGDISYTESEEYLKRKSNCSSNSKDINEKATPSSPGTPTNASNSLSLSDGKDDFLIDDEIADQPALVFEDRSHTCASEAFSQNTSENTPTMVDSPKPKRRPLQPFDSPLMVKNKKFLESRTGSLDTLSPCESIASDDLMMDFDYSQSSGLDECDNNRTNGYSSLPDTVNRREEYNETASRSDLSFLSATLVGTMMNEKLGKTGSRSRLLQSSRTSTPNSIPDSPRSFRNGRPSVTASPIRSRLGQLSNSGYDSDDSIRLDRANHTAMKQDIMSIKTMLLKLRRVLNESETHNPFESQATLTNGLFNNDSSLTDSCGQIESDDAKEELAELRRQVLFLQGQLEDKEKSLQTLQEQVIKLTTDSFISNSAPASTVAYSNNSMCNAATQTERVRPISAGPSLLNGASTDGNAGSLVSVNEPSTTTPSPSRRSRPPQHTNESGASKRTPSRLWRKPGEPPSPQRYATSSAATSSIPRRANSRSRTPSSTPT